jgi:hypothetical protein
VEEGGGGGARGSGHWAGGRKCRMGWSRVGEAREQGNRGPEGVLDAHATATASCRPGGVQVGVARARKDQQGRAGAAAGVQVTRGVCPSRRWRLGGVRAAVGGAGSRWQRGAEEQSKAPEEEEERGGSEGLVCKNRKSRDLTVN